MSSRTVALEIGRSVIRLVMLIVIALALVCGLVVVQGQHSDLRRVDAIVIICPPAHSPPAAHAQHALHLYSQGYASHILVVGKEDTPRFVRNLLVELKVPEQAILTAEGGHNQQETIRRAVALAYQQRVHAVLVVDAPEAMLGNLKIARDLGMEAYGAPLPRLTPAPAAILHASFDYWRYVLFGRG